MTRVAAIQAGRRMVPHALTSPTDVLGHVERNLDELAALARRASADGCAIAAFPEDTLGLLEWEAGNWQAAPTVLRLAEAMVLERFGEIARAGSMNIICCSDTADRGGVYNTAILIGPDGAEIGRYHKVNLPIHEQARQRGGSFPVFEAPGVGSVGLCICYDMLFPETARALALNGADIIFHLTMGGASMGGADASLAAMRTRAGDNFVYLVVAFRGGGSLIVGPKAEVLAQGGDEPDAIVWADINVTGGREAGDAIGGITSDYRARLFAERVPSAYAVLTQEAPPGLARLSHVDVPTGEQASVLGAEALTTGSDAFGEAEALFRDGMYDEARPRFEALAAKYGTIWIGNVARERIAAMGRRSG